MERQLTSPSQIEESLQSIWDSLQGTSKMRACLFNLIIACPKGAVSNYFYSVAQAVIRKFPSRIIFAVNDEISTGDGLKSSVSVLSAEEGATEIVCDLILLEASGTHRERLPFVVLPHILPDLPIYFLYGYDPNQKTPIATHLEHVATRTIFDSETVSSLPDFARGVLNHLHRYSADIADLSWARIENWRDLLSRTFHPLGDLDLLRSATSLTISYTGTPVQAIYLQGWLATQLRWKLKSASLACFQYENCKVDLIQELCERGARPRVTHVEITTSSGHHFNFKRSLDDPSHILIEHSTPSICSLPTVVLFDKDEVGVSTVREVTHKGTSTHYLSLIESLASLKELQ